MEEYQDDFDYGWDCDVVDFDYDLQQKITGKQIGSDNRDKPFWMEGYATYFSHLYY